MVGYIHLGFEHMEEESQQAVHWVYNVPNEERHTAYYEIKEFTEELLEAMNSKGVIFIRAEIWQKSLKNK